MRTSGLRVFWYMTINRATVLRSRLPLMSMKTFVKLAGSKLAARAMTRLASKASATSNCTCGRFTRACSTSIACWSRPMSRQPSPASTLVVPPTWLPTSRTRSVASTSLMAAARYSPTSSHTTIRVFPRARMFVLCLLLFLCSAASAADQVGERSTPHSHMSPGRCGSEALRANQDVLFLAPAKTPITSPIAAPPAARAAAAATGTFLPTSVDTASSGMAGPDGRAKMA
mmetsp:Transcript_9208/g.25763  ORF Transcript_9208/g.25763 Transcript_9208/m.25763 type:complete len:229 (-) Transcript_9208:3-689(-)